MCNFIDIERRQKEEEEKKAAEALAEKERLAIIETERKREAKAEKNATKKERQKLRALAKEDDYWLTEDDLQLQMMERVEFLCTAFNAAKLSQLNESLHAADVEERPDIVTESVEQHKLDEQDKNRKVDEKQNTEKAESAVISGGWNVEDVQLLTKAMVVIPSGTLNRWDVISVYMAEHGATKEREGKVILKKAKELEKQSHRGPMDAQAAFKKYQDSQDQKKMEGKKNTAESNEGSSNVNYFS